MRLTPKVKNARRRFYRLLRKTAKTVTFRVERDAVIGSSPTHGWACPIASIYNVETGNQCFNTRAKSHATDLGFGEIAQSIMDAADNVGHHDKTLRKTIMRICSLKS